MTYKDFLYSKASARRIPIGGAFELSPVCNLACHMCYVRKTPEELRRHNQRLRTVEEWIAMARQCKEAGLLYLLLTGGEPFLYPEFRRLYEALHDMGFLISMNSNGTMIDEETIAWLSQRAPERVNITLYGASEATYEGLCQNGSGYARALRGIRLLKEAGIHVVINSSITPENKADLREIIETAHGFGCRANVATYMFPPVRRDREEMDSRLDAEESGYYNVIKQKYRLGEERFYLAGMDLLAQEPQIEREGGEVTAEPSLNAAEGEVGEAAEPSLNAAEPLSDGTWGSDERNEMKCRAGRSSFWISWEGKMSACAMMDFPLACDPFADGFVNCWQRINEAVHRATVMSTCNHCEKKWICQPCAAIVHAETGDVNGRPTYLCRVAQVTEATWRRKLEALQGKYGEA